MNITYQEYKSLCNQREQLAKQLIITALDGHLPERFELIDDKSNMYGNAILRLRPKTRVDGASSIHFIHQLNHRTLLVNDQLRYQPSVESIRVVADVFNENGYWISDSTFGIDGQIQETILTADSMASSIAILVSKLLATRQLNDIEWKIDETLGKRCLELSINGELVDSILRINKQWRVEMYNPDGPSRFNTKREAENHAIDGALLAMMTTHQERLAGLQ